MIDERLSKKNINAWVKKMEQRDKLRKFIRKNTKPEPLKKPQKVMDFDHEPPPEIDAEDYFV